MRPNLRDLEETYFFPILNAPHEASPRRAIKLAVLQCEVIDMLRTVVYPCSGQHTLPHALELTLSLPAYRHIWEDAQALGFRTPLDTKHHYLAA